MEIIRAVCRIEKASKTPAIFYWEEDRLQCFTFNDMHTEAGPEYYRTATRLPLYTLEFAACERLVNHYALICANHKEMLVIGKRLTQK